MIQRIPIIHKNLHRREPPHITLYYYNCYKMPSLLTNYERARKRQQQLQRHLCDYHASATSSSWLTGQKVTFLESEVSSRHTCPKTPLGDQAVLFYSANDFERFRHDSVDHYREYKRLMDEGRPAIECLVAFPDDKHSGQAPPTISNEVLVTEIPEEAVIIEEEEYYDALENERQVRFSFNVVSSERECPATRPEEMQVLYYSIDELTEFWKESEDHCNQYDELVNKGVPSIDCLAAFPDHPDDRCISHEEYMESVRPTTKHSGQAPPTISNEVLVTEIPEEAVIIEEEEYYDALENERQVRFSFNVVSSERECPATRPEEMQVLYYSIDELTEFWKESEDHCNQYDELVNKGVPSIDCLAAFPDHPDDRCISHEEYMESVRPTTKRRRISQQDEPSAVLLDDHSPADMDWEYTSSTQDTVHTVRRGPLSRKTIILLEPIEEEDYDSLEEEDMEQVNPPVSISDEVDFASSVCASTEGGLAKKKMRVKSRLLRELESTLDGRYWKVSG